MVFPNDPEYIMRLSLLTQKHLTNPESVLPVYHAAAPESVKSCSQTATETEANRLGK